MKKIKWACPKCGSGPECTKHESCLGFICECATDTEDHGTTYADPCTNANCYHCEWGGTFPKLPGKVPPWAKKALEAGWKPPKNWTP